MMPAQVMDGDAPQDKAIGTTFAGRYRITGVLGVGGMGTVYRADDAQGGGPVALKVLRKHLVASDEAEARLRREAFVMKRLAHPNCVAVTDVGVGEDGSFYLAMELLAGESLGDLLERERRLPWRRALHVARHVLRGLDHAHHQSVVHRDIKPDNVYLVRHGDDPDFAKILDFGIAKLAGDLGAAAITQAGITVGTPKYLSPEQAMGETLDGRSDLYSLSIVLYEMLAGRPPFDHEEPLKILFAHARTPPPRFAAVCPDAEIPPGVEALVMEGLAKRPDERIGSASEYIVTIDALLAPPAAMATVALPPPPPAPTVTVARPRSRRGLIAVIAAVLLIGGIAAAVALTAEDDEPRAAPAPEVAPPPPPAPAPVPPEVTEQIARLRQGKTCTARRKAVARLKVLGYPAAIPALREAAAKPARGKDRNACLRAEAEAAIVALTPAPR